MNWLRRFFVILCGLSILGLQAKTRRLEFVFVVPSYNNEKYARRNLESLIGQETEHSYSIIVVNDCSTDKTGEILESIKREHNLSNTFLKIIHNKKRVGALANIYNTIHSHCKNHQIVALVDGDDFLATSKVLERVAREYRDPEILMTYGQFVFYPAGEWGTTYEIPRETLENKELRTLTYVAQHLRTFKAGLFKNIKKKHLMLDGEFYKMNADMATMIPMLEMAAPIRPGGKIRSVFIPDILLIYNFDNPLNDHTVDRSLQLSLEDVIRALPPYKPIKKYERSAHEI